jgi:hypothetical protein
MWTYQATLWDGAGRVFARILGEALVGLEHVPVRSPRVCGTARHVTVREMPRCGSTVLRCKVELRGGPFVDSRRHFQRLVQFQTLTSR